MVTAAWAAVGIAAAAIFSMGGVVFGVASLYPVLYSEHVLERSSCTAAEANICAARNLAEKCCDAQQVQYTLMSSVALFAADGAMLLYGELGDRAGPRSCFGTGAVLAWLALGLMALNVRLQSDALWYGAFFALGCSGPGVFMGCLFLGERYPEMRSVISGVGASMWDGSAMVFLLFNTAYFATATEGARPSFGLDAICLAWLGLSAVVGVACWFQLPSWKLVVELRAGAGGAGTQPLAAADSDAEDGGGGRTAAPTFLEQFLRRDTLLMLMFMAVYNLKSSFYITTFADQAKSAFDAETADSLAMTFDLAFPLGGFVTSVFASLLLERLGEREDLYMAIVLVMALLFGFCSLVPHVAAQYAGALLFGPTRTLQWACYFHFLSLPRRYAPQYVGRLLGYGNLVVAVVGDFPPYLLNTFVSESGAMGSVSGRYFAVHLGLQVVLLSCLVLPFYLWCSRDAKAGAAGRLARGSSCEMLPAAEGRARSQSEEELDGNVRSAEGVSATLRMIELTKSAKGGGLVGADDLKRLARDRVTDEMAEGVARSATRRQHQG